MQYYCYLKRDKKQITRRVQDIVCLWSDRPPIPWDYLWKWMRTYGDLRRRQTEWKQRKKRGKGVARTFQKAKTQRKRAKLWVTEFILHSERVWLKKRQTSLEQPHLLSWDIIKNEVPAGIGLVSCAWLVSDILRGNAVFRPFGSSS